MLDTLTNMKNALAYIEENLDGEIVYDRIAQIALCSPYHFQRMFVFLTGVPLSEYIRRRRLTLAAFDLQNSDRRIIDIALKYGYTSPDAFSRAFLALHKVTPSKAREKSVPLKAYPPISFSLSVKGVLEMVYRIEEKPSFKVVGIKERLSYAEDLGQKVGEMWSRVSCEIYEQLTALQDMEPVGLVGVYDQMYDDQSTDYYVGTRTTKACPENLAELNVPAQTWAVFEITGPLPAAMRDVWGRIFSEWFPTAEAEYEHAEAPEVEWYSPGDMGSETYKSEIWIPVTKKTLR